MCRILHRWVNDGSGQEVSGGRGDSESATPATDKALLPTQSPVCYTYTSAPLGSARLGLRHTHTPTHTEDGPNQTRRETKAQPH